MRINQKAEAKRFCLFSVLMKLGKIPCCGHMRKSVCEVAAGVHHVARGIHIGNDLVGRITYRDGVIAQIVHDLNRVA